MISCVPASGCPNSTAGDLLCPVGKTPQYLGQPVALLVFAHLLAKSTATPDEPRTHERLDGHILECSIPRCERRNR